MRVDAHSYVPIYLQIVEEVRSGVARGVYQADEALPSVRELALALGVNPNTVQKAYEELEREGLILSRRGLGMFVQQNGAQSARARSVSAVAAGLEKNLRQARAADMPADGVQKIFQGAMMRVYAKEPKR